MEVKRKAYCEQPLATINVMNRIAKLFGYGPLRGTTEVSGHYTLFLREVKCARPTTNPSRKERKEGAVRVARTECVYSAEELSYDERNQDWHIHRDYNRVVQPIVYADRVLIPDQAVTPPSEGTSIPVKATCDERRPEQELRKSREELRVIHDNHGIDDARASMDECINENNNPQWEVSASGVTKPKDRVLRDKTNVAHHGTPPKKNKGAGKPKDTLATKTSDSPRASQDDLVRIAWPCSPKRKQSSPSRKRSAGISKTAYDPLGAQAKRAAQLRTAYADHRSKQQFDLGPSRNLHGCEEDLDSI
jgi:hypothetical protein